MRSNAVRDLMRSIEWGTRERPLSPAARSLVGDLAKAARIDEAVALAEIDVATARSGAQRRFAFDAVKARVDDVDAGIERLDALYLVRRDALVARAERWLPESCRAAAVLDVVVVVGFEPPRAEFARGADGRARLLLDVSALVDREPLDEAAAEVVVGALVRAALTAESAAPLPWIGGPVPAAAAARAFVEAVVDAASRPPNEGFDEQGRRLPEFDLRARTRIAEFADELEALGSPTRVQEHPITHRERFEAFAVHGAAIAVLSDALLAIERFAGPGALRAAIEAGPTEVLARYAELSGRTATLPSVPPEAASRWLTWITST
ncbi:MAG: hypothetical protein IT459_06495 [Planctomycetes bacterium]|nr:hypothetical protein [Planctomycetota bacterium]